jgi:hypothetical protein
MSPTHQKIKNDVKEMVKNQLVQELISKDVDDMDTSRT